MLRLRTAWAASSRPNRLLAIAGIAVPIAVVSVVTAMLLAAPPGAAKPSPIADQPRPSESASASASDSIAIGPSPSAPSATPAPPGSDPLLGTDGRLTVLLLGSDYRPAHPGNRTDAIMVVSVDPSTGKSAAFSVPRDTVDFPIGGGKVFTGKVNALYQSLQTQTKDGGVAMQSAVGAAFGIEVDGYVFIGFRGVRDLVGAVGGVDVHLDRAYFDPDYWVTSKKQGWGLPAGTSHLGPESALIFARSRKGDNDFGRARRQQILVMAALAKVRTRGPAILPKLLGIANTSIRTDLPLDRATDLFALISRTDLSRVTRTVFGPRTYATSRGGTSFALRLDVCRAWIRTHFPPVRLDAPWPEASPSPSASATP